MGEHKDRYQRALDGMPNKKIARFIQAYSGDGAEAARIAGYSKKSAAQQASRLLKRPDVQHALELRSLAEAEEKGLSTDPPPPPQPHPEDHPSPRKVKSAGKPDSIEPKGHRVNNAVNLNSAAVNSGQSSSNHGRKRAVKGGHDEDEEQEERVRLPEMTREDLVTRAKLTRTELLGWLTGVVLGEVLIPRMTMFGVPYMAGASMTERLKAADQIAKINGWQITTTAQLNNVEELTRYRDVEARRARLEDLRAERQARAKRLEELKALRDEEEE
jgi:hypothetical protein